MGMASSVDISAEASSLVGSSVGAAWVSTGMGAQVYPSGDPLLRCGTLQDGIIREGHIRFHHLPQFLHTSHQKV